MLYFTELHSENRSHINQSYHHKNLTDCSLLQGLSHQKIFYEDSSSTEEQTDKPANQDKYTISLMVDTPIC